MATEYENTISVNRIKEPIIISPDVKKILIVTEYPSPEMMEENVAYWKIQS